MSLDQNRTEQAIYIGELLYKQAGGLPLADNERADLAAWADQSPERAEILKRAVERSASVAEVRSLSMQYNTAEAVKKIFKATGLPAPVEYGSQSRRRRLIYWAAAAIVISLIVTGAGVFMKRHAVDVVRISPSSKEIPPGGNKAILILADGKTIRLDSAGNGRLAKQGAAVINKTAGGLLQYNLTTDRPDANVADEWNSVSTPAGGQYHLILADGTNVWLNALSSIRFPAVFSGGKREVMVTGETYFDVAQDAGKPFRVMCAASGGPQVEVLGTSFNINAYDDGEHSTIATLVQGKVRVSNGSFSSVLDPGQQAQVMSGDGTVRIVNNVDVDLVAAWKNGLFKFNNTPVKEVMQQLARWYDIDVRYEGTIKNRKFSGEIARNTNLSSVLDLLSLLKINFTLSDTASRKVLTITSQ